MNIAVEHGNINTFGFSPNLDRKLDIDVLFRILVDFEKSPAELLSDNLLWCLPSEFARNDASNFAFFRDYRLCAR